MTDETEKDGAVVHWPLAGYRKFLSPDELKARKEAEARGEVADVIRLDSPTAETAPFNMIRDPRQPRD